MTRPIPKSAILMTRPSSTRQFRAARSRWITLFSSRYAIPADTWVAMYSIALGIISFFA